MARFTILATLCVLLMSSAVWASVEQAEYVDGTVTNIPQNTKGNLDLGGAQSLRFLYGSASFELPYEQITGFRLGENSGGVGSQLVGGAAKVGRTILPMFFSGRKRLTIDFRSVENTNTQSLVFELPADEAKAALPVLRARTRVSQPQAVEEEQVADAEPTRGLHSVGEWWGDSLWRTERNKHLWPDTSKKQPQVAASDQQPAEQPVQVAASQDE